MTDRELPTSKRLLLVNRDFQFRYTRASVAVGIVSTVLTATVILYPLFLFKILVIPQFLPPPILMGMVAAALVNIAMLIIFGILISHKIAGPMFSLVRHIRRLASGNWRTEIRMRPGDELHLIVRNLNDLSLSLVQAVEKDLESIGRLLEQESVQKSESTSAILRELEARMKSRIASTLTEPS
jgi:methyl-accepting chemotaxis protein